MIKKFILPFLIIISILIYYRWVNFQVFLYGDWRFLFKESLISGFSPSFWENYNVAFGGVNILIWRYPLDFLNGIFGYLGFASNVSEKFLYFWPIILITPISSFFLVKKLTKSNLAGFVSSLVFSYNTYFLSINTQGHLLLTVAFSWAVFAILAFIYLFETKKRIFIFLTALLLFIVGAYDLRSLYVTVGIIFLYAIYHQFIIEEKRHINLRINLINSVLVFFILGLLNLYWILPFLFAHTLTNNAVLSRQILAGTFYSLQGAISIFYPFWTGDEPTWFFVQKIPIYFWLYPILAFSGLLLARKNKQIVFWGIIGIIGIFLTKQDTPPFAHFYNFLYSNVPGFSAFREASKFYFLVVLSYSVLIGYFTVFIWNYFKNRKYLKYIFIILIAFLPLWNAAPLLTGNIRTIFLSKSIPEDLKIVNSHLENDSVYSRAFWINLDLFWVPSTNTHPVVEGSSNTVDYYWPNEFTMNLDPMSSESAKIIKFTNSDQGRRILSLWSFKYLISNRQGNVWNNFRIDEGNELSNSFKKVDYLKPVVIGTRSTSIFENIYYKHHVYKTFEKENVEKDIQYIDIPYEELNPFKYIIDLKNVNSPFYLNFTDNYHPDWKLYLGKFSWLNVLLNKQEYVDDKNHLKNVVGFNSFYVDPQIICLENNVCKRNSDGSYDISLTLFFKPQAYLYFGLIISVSTLIIVLGSILYLYVKKEK